MLKKSRIFILWTLIFLPSLIFFLQDSARTQYFQLGKITGLISISALVFTLILGCRSYWLDRYFGSLSASYRIHHQVGMVALIFLFPHILGVLQPLLVVDRQLAWEFLVDFKDPVILSGWSALVILILGLVFSHWKKMKRGTWIWLHRILILCFPVSLIHFYFATTQFGMSEILTLIYSLLALLVLLLHYFYPKPLRQIFQYKVLSVKNKGADTVEIFLEPAKEKIKFFPGQFAYLSIKCTEGCGVSHEFHPFTLDSNPDNQIISIAVKALGDDSSKLQHVLPESEAILEGPYGNLFESLEPDRPQLWIAGGIGITPFLSYLRHHKKNNKGKLNIFIIILIKKLEENIFAEDFTNVHGVQTLVHSDEQEGFPCLNQLLPEDWKERVIVISGTTAMVKAFKKNLSKLGAKNIRTEEFEF
jgi:predicted ferric reductase